MSTQGTHLTIVDGQVTKSRFITEGSINTTMNALVGTRALYGRIVKLGVFEEEWT